MRLIKAVARNAVPESTIRHRWQALALQKLQEEAEFFLIEVFADAKLTARHVKSVAITRGLHAPSRCQ